MVSIRAIEPDDVETVVDFALRAWAPVFDSMEEQVGPRMFRHLFGEDWRAYQGADIRRALTTYDVSVADVSGEVAGYVAVDLPDGETHGEIYMIAVNPDHQGSGIGTALTEHAIDQIRDAGRDLVVVNTGADPGHAPARATYEKAGFTPMPGVAYYLLT